MEGDPLQFLEPGLQTNEKHVDRNAGTVRIADFILRGDTLHFDERFQPVSFVIKPLGQLELAQPEVALGDITVVRLILPFMVAPPVSISFVATLCLQLLSFFWGML